jgi:hypothetical protein
MEKISEILSRWLSSHNAIESPVRDTTHAVALKVYACISGKVENKRRTNEKKTLTTNLLLKIKM